MIDIRMAAEIDEPRLRQFLAEHWSADHIFVNHAEVFRWQYRDPYALVDSRSAREARFNMVIAETEGVVCGVLGFIPMGRFSPRLGDRDVMLAIWKVVEGGPPGVGLGLLKYLQAQLRPRLIAAIGTSEMVRPIYKALRYEVGVLEQWALFNPDRRGRLVVASGVPDVAFDAAEIEASVDLVPLSEVGDGREVVNAIASGQTPQKDWEYVQERFVEHPWYTYDVRVAVAGGRPIGVAVWRTVRVRDTNVLRIVDLIGPPDWISGARGAFLAVLRRSDSEYIDLMEHGVDAELLQAAGFVAAAGHEHLVIPNYFSPFEDRNVRIELAYRRFDGDGPVRLFRADSDQDRPNRSTELSGH